jgi:hypothetical protein
MRIDLCNNFVVKMSQSYKEKYWWINAKKRPDDNYVLNKKIREPDGTN